MKIDLWSVGAVLAELHTGYVLFQNDSVPTMLARIAAVLGKFPDEMLKNGRESPKFFTVSGVVYERNEAGFSLVYPKRTTLRSRLHLTPPPLRLTTDEAEFLDFTKWLLEVHPDKRPYAEEALGHVWLQNNLGHIPSV